MRSPRRSLIGSYRYTVVIKPDKAEYSSSMSGNLDLYDGKHVEETHKFTSFDQLATIIMNFWEKKLGNDVNIHRFSNWLSEYFSDIGVTNIDFYQMLETVRELGKGVVLQSSGVAIRESKVIHEYLGDKKVKPTKEVDLKPAGTFVDVRGEGMEPEAAKLRPEEPPTDTVLKPSEIFKTEETVSPVVTHIPVQKEEEEEKPEPPVNTLLKPSEVLKERDSVVFIEDEPRMKAQVSGDPVVTKPQEKTVKKTPPSDTLLKPSEYLKQREIIDVIFKTPAEPTMIPEEKKTEFSVDVEKLESSSDKLLRPSEYLKEMEIEADSDDIEKPLEKVDKESVVKSPTATIDPEVKKIPSPPISEIKQETEEVDEEEGEIIEFGIEIKKESESKLEGKSREIKTKEDLRVTDIMGVGDKTAITLETAGFDTIQKILESTPEILSKLPGIGITSAKRLIYGANALMKKGLEIIGDEAKAQAKKSKDLNLMDVLGIGSKTAMLLKEGGYNTVEKILEATPESLSKVPGIGVAAAEKLIQAAKELLET